MELFFSDSSLQGTLESRVKVDARFGVSRGALVQQRLCELLAADSLAVVASLHGMDLKLVEHSLGTFSVELAPGSRLRFQVDREPIPRLRGDGQIDFSQVGAIRILDLEEM